MTIKTVVYVNFTYFPAKSAWFRIMYCNRDIIVVRDESV